MSDILASMYNDLAAPPGIPWDGLVAQGHGITQDSYDPAYMDTMLQEGTKFLNVLGLMSQEFRDKYRTIQAGDARHAMTQLMALIKQTGADVWQATKQGDWGASIHFPRSLAVDSLATLAASAMNGAYLHYDGVMEAALLAGKITPDELMAHAQAIVQTFETFTDLNKNGHLDQFKTTPPVAGFGGPEVVAAPPLLAGWALAALGIMLVLGLCFLVYVFGIASPIESKVASYCDKLSKTGTTADMQTCVKALTSMEQSGNSSILGFMGGILEPILVVGAVGVALYVGSLILPGVLVKIGKGVAA